MLFGPASGNQPNSVTPLSIGNVNQSAIAHSDQVHSFLAIILARVEAFHGKWIAECLDCFVELDAVITPVGGRLGVISLEFEHHTTTDYPYLQDNR